MARPKKSGLDFYYTDVHHMDGYRMMQLMNRYGPLGYAVYSYVLSRIYLNGYYLEFPLEILAAQTIRVIGAGWVKKPGKITEIMEYCGEIGLFDSELMKQSVLTSREIQANYSFVAARRSADRSKYWILDEENDEKDGDDGRNHVDEADSEVIAAIIPQSKVNKRKQNEMIAKRSKGEKSKANPLFSEGLSGAAEQAESDDEYLYDDAPLVTTEYDRTESSASSEYIYDDGYDGTDNGTEGMNTGIDGVYFIITGRHLNGYDMEELNELRAFGASDSEMINIMETVARRGEKDIYSFKYFVPIIRQKLCLNG